MSEASEGKDSHEDDSLHEWLIGLCCDEEEASGTEGMSSPRSPKSHETKSAFSQRASLSMTASKSNESDGVVRRASRWRTLRTRMVLDRFAVQVRCKEDIG